MVPIRWSGLVCSGIRSLVRRLTARLDSPMPPPFSATAFEVIWLDA